MPEAGEGAAADGNAVAEGRHAALAAELEADGGEDASLLVLCELVLSSNKRSRFERRRDRLLEALRHKRYSSPAIARALRAIACDLPDIRVENRVALIHDIFASTSDEEALTTFLASIEGQPDLAGDVLNRFLLQDDPFSLLLRLLSCPLLEPLQESLTDAFLRAARQRQDLLWTWARRNRSAFLEGRAFSLLLVRDGRILGPICKEVLREGTREERRHLLTRLTREGSERALRLLVLGVPYGDEPCDPEILRALGRFPHPLAASVLREVVHRSNTQRLRPEEARDALRSLRRMATEESGSFLREVARGRRLGMPRYRSELRRLAARALEDTAT